MQVRCQLVCLGLAVAGLVSGLAFGQVEAYWDFEDKTPGTPLASQERLADSSGSARDAFADGGAARPAVVPGSTFFGQNSMQNPQPLQRSGRMMILALGAVMSSESRGLRQNAI